MAQQNPTIYESKVEAADEHQDRGTLDFLEKKEEENKPQDELSVPEFAKDHVLKAEEMKEEEEAENKPTPVQNPAIYESKVEAADEQQDRRILDFLEKKEEENKPQDELSVPEFAKDHVLKAEEMKEEEEAENKPTPVQNPAIYESKVEAADEQQDRRILDFLEKKEEENKPQDELSVPEFAKDHVLKAEEMKEEEEAENKPTPVQNPAIYESKVEAADEQQDRGILDFLEKKEEENKPQDELSVPEFAKDHVLKAEEMKEEEEAENKPTPVQNPAIYESNAEAADETQDHGILDFLEKKEEENKPQDELSVPDFAKDHVLKAEEMKEEAENKPTLVQNPAIYESKVEAADEHQDRGNLDFLEKKEEENKPEDELSVPDFAKDHVVKAEEMKEEAEAEEHHNPTLVNKLDRSNSISSNEEDKPKQGLKEKIKENVTADKTEDHEVVGNGDTVEPEEKKSFMEKIKAKLPGAHKEDHTEAETTPVPPTKTNIQEEEIEKKGFMEKIKEKLPGHHKDAADAKTVE